MSIDPRTKPLSRKAYGSIGHLPCSRMGPGDHAVPPGMGRIVTVRARDKHDRVIVQEKLDGSCVAVALLEGMLHPLGRAGWPAVSSRFEQHRHFHNWVMLHADRFRGVLRQGERLVGEWLMQAHGTRYNLAGREPFVAFDILRGEEREPFDAFTSRVADTFATPTVLATSPTSVESAMSLLGEFGRFGALDPVEGVVYRCERKGAVEFLAKYVRPDKADGVYLPEISGQAAVWNWRPELGS